MSTITLTADQATQKAAFDALLATGLETKIGGFKLDATKPGAYIVDPVSKKLLYRANLADVDLSVINPAIKPAIGTTAAPIIKSWQLIWDTNGVCQNNPNLSLVQVVS